MNTLSSSAPLAGAPAAPMPPLLAANLAAMACSYAFIALAGPLVRLLQLQAWHLGLVITLVGVVWTAVAPRWAGLAERIGRRQALRRALLGVALAMLAIAAYTAWALDRPVRPGVATSLAVLLLARGAMGACLPGVPVAALAWLAERTPPDRRAAAMARYGSAGSLGMVLAPPLAGALGTLDIALALAVAALLPVWPWLWLGRLPEQLPPPARPAGRPRLRPFDPRIRWTWLAALALHTAILVVNVCLGLFVIDRLGLDPKAAGVATGVALGAAGLALMLSQTIVSKSPRVRPVHWLCIGALLGAAGFGSLLGASAAWMVGAGCALAGLGMGMAFPAVAAQAANAVGPGEQPAAAAAMAMAQGTAMVMAPLLGAGLYDWRPDAPFVLVPALFAAMTLAVVAAGARHRRGGQQR